MVIPASTNTSLSKSVQHNKQLRVAAYCRVSTDSDEQINSYEVQKRKYEDMIKNEPGWELVKIYADKGITGTSTKNRDEFNNMIRQCKRGKIDMIITKSVSRFARNTLDCLKFTRMLRKIGVDVYFEEQGIHSIKAASDFYISLFGTIAQSESENISENVKWGKQQAAKEGRTNFVNSLGYRKGKDGKPEIVPEEAIIVQRIYKLFLSGYTLGMIAEKLQKEGIKSPSGMDQWSKTTLKSILTNVKYKGDILINKSYVTDCISKTVKRNNGERPQYYVRNNHVPIIDEETFDRVQMEFAKRGSRRIAARVHTVTELGKYSGKYALADILVCGCCGTPYRRKIYMYKGNTRIPVWRCIRRMDKGSDCPESATLKEDELKREILTVIRQSAHDIDRVLSAMRQELETVMGFRSLGIRGVELQVKVTKLQEQCDDMIRGIKFDEDMNATPFDDELFEKLMLEKNQAEEELEKVIQESNSNTLTSRRIDEIIDMLSALKNHPYDWDDVMIRQLVDKIVVEGKNHIRIIFIGGYEVERQW